jgi:hypothetical protein
MDELGWSWPAWKFGMKREDLTTKLHDQYNTFPSSIQDPEAFHHDVYEISNEASTTDEFHRMMAARKQQRLQELSDSLESAAFEIIAHPKLVGTEQWQYALQLFRTRSLDSLVRYFSSYLPSGYQTPSSAGTSFAEASSVGTASTNLSTVDDDDHNVPVPTFLAKEDKAVFTQEPQELHDTTFISLDSKIPLSPRSMTMKSDTTASSQSADDISTHDFALSHPPTPPRTLSFSGSESESVPALAKSLSDDDDSSQSEADSPAASESDLMESRSSLESLGFSESKSGHLKDYHYNDDEEEDIPSAQMPADSFFDGFETVQVPLESCEAMEAETPTPRQETVSSCYIDAKSFPQHHLHRPRSPNRSASPKSTRLPRCDMTSPGPRRGCISRRSPEEVFSRIQKPSLPDPARTRARGRISATRLE